MRPLVRAPAHCFGERCSLAKATAPKRKKPSEREAETAPRRSPRGRGAQPSPSSSTSPVSSVTPTHGGRRRSNPKRATRINGTLAHLQQRRTTGRVMESQRLGINDDVGARGLRRGVDKSQDTASAVCVHLPVKGSQRGRCRCRSAEYQASWLPRSSANPLRPLKGLTGTGGLSRGRPRLPRRVLTADLYRRFVVSVGCGF